MQPSDGRLDEFKISITYQQCTTTWLEDLNCIKSITIQNRKYNVHFDDMDIIVDGQKLTHLPYYSADLKIMWVTTQFILLEAPGIQILYSQNRQIDITLNEDIFKDKVIYKLL